MKKNFKRFICAIMAVAIAISISPFMHPYTVYADTAKNFTDLNGDEYYYSYVKEMVEKGVISGYDDNTFRGMNTITWAEALAMVLRGAGIKVDNPNGGQWYDGIRSWYVDNKIVSASQSMTTPITRKEIVHVINELYAIPQYKGPSYFSDTNDNVINSFYLAKIIGGTTQPVFNDNTAKFGIFSENDNIRRGDFCIIESRVINQCTLKTVESVQKPIDGLTTRTLDPVDTIPCDRFCFENLVTCMRWALEQRQGETVYLMFNYGKNEGTDKAYFVDKLKCDNYCCNARDYVEDCGYTWESLSNAITYGCPSRVLPADFPYLVIKLELNPITDRTTGKVATKNYSYNETIEGMEALFQDMASSMNVTDKMSDKEKAKAAQKYIAYNFAYDEKDELCIDFSKKVAVCCGYAAMFSYMLNRMGIECVGAMGKAGSSSLADGRHIWSRVYDKETDKWYNCDVTWDDSVPDRGYGHCDFDFFWTTDEEMKRLDKYREDINQNGKYWNELIEWDNTHPY